jgi:hypothetical protein
MPECENCIKESFDILKESFNKMIGARSVEKWLIRVVVGALLIGNMGIAGLVLAAAKEVSAQNVKIELNTAALVEIKSFVQQHTIEHSDFEEHIDTRTVEILEAISKIR